MSSDWYAASWSNECLKLKVAGASGRVVSSPAPVNSHERAIEIRFDDQVGGRLAPETMRSISPEKSLPNTDATWTISFADPDRSSRARSRLCNGRGDFPEREPR